MEWRMKRILLMSALLLSSSMQCAEKTGEFCIEMIEMNDMQANCNSQTIQPKKSRCTPAHREAVKKVLGYVWRVALYVLPIVGIGAGLETIGESIHFQTSSQVQPHDKLVSAPYCRYEYDFRHKYEAPDPEDYCENKPCSNYTKNYTKREDEGGRIIEVCEYHITYYSPSV